MTSYEVSSAQCAGAKLTRPVELVCFALILANFVPVVTSYMQGSWLTPDGIADFDTTWVAGRMAFSGHAAATYDWATLKHVAEGVVGHPLAGFLGWRYPPAYFFVTAPLALLPYATALIVWVVGTFAAYLITIRAIVGDRVGYFLAAASPAVLANFMIGQNGLLSASLIGGALILMDRRPIWAGVLLGLLTYKPHLGLLFPLALAVSGRWLVFVSAGLVAALAAAASWVVFGGDSWQAFFHSMGPALAIENFADWGKLQSAFGVVRSLGGSEDLAWLVQTVVTLTAGVAVIVFWRSRVAYEIKAAALSTAVLLAAPHLLTYDLAVLTVPLAFLFRLGHARGFLPYELAGMAAAYLLILIFPLVVAPVGFAAILVVASLVINRALAPHTARPAETHDRRADVALPVSR